VAPMEQYVSRPAQTSRTRPSVRGARSVNRTGRGLRKLSPEMLAQAQDQTIASVTRIILTLVVVSLFCALSLFLPDSSFLIGEDRLFDFPFAGPVSSRGFLVVGPLILVALRVYLQIYAEHWQQL
jgi:hypothetical protein